MILPAMIVARHFALLMADFTVIVSDTVKSISKNTKPYRCHASISVTANSLALDLASGMENL
jgi:hypothetical protein